MVYFVVLLVAMINMCIIYIYIYIYIYIIYMYTHVQHRSASTCRRCGMTRRMLNAVAKADAQHVPTVKLIDWFKCVGSLGHDDCLKSRSTSCRHHVHCLSLPLPLPLPLPLLFFVLLV